jgi:DMSO reductase family type II enzyme chaperone
MLNGTRQNTSALLERAALFRLLAQAFTYPAEGHRSAIERQLSGIGSIPPRDAKSKRAFERLRRAWRQAEDAELQEEYARLFLARGLVSLHETAYGDGRRIAGRAAELADIGGFYTAFGLRMAEADPDLPDHLCSELEFYSLLLVKLAYADRGGWSPKREITRRAAAKFLEEHLGRWTGALTKEIRTHSAASPYRELADLLDALIAAESRRTGARPVLLNGRLPRDFMQDDAFICPREGVPEPPHAVA